ncbi:MAG TPA: HDOD domain-containing protein [Candidatus Binatus sp.]|nr:HDOD domain-containing protein [Candidatus Binatus sp.]
MAGGPSTSTDAHAVRVLLVEDSTTDQELVKRVFRDPAPLPGVELEIVGDADAALAAVRYATFEVILTDYSLPGRNGLELLRQLRDIDDGTPVVMMTGTGDEALAVAALQQGAADYVVKDLGFERGLPVVIDRVLAMRAAEIETENARQRSTQHTKRLERQVEEQTTSLRRALQESEALRRVGQALAAARDIKPALDVVTQTTAQLLRAQAAVVMIRADADLVLASVWGALKQALGLKSPDLLAVLGAGWHETAAAALREGDAEIGLLWAGRSRPQAFAARDLELLETLADMTALSIANVRAHEQLRRLRGGDRKPASAPQVATPVTSRPPTASAAAGPVDASTLVVPAFPPALVRLLALAESDDARPEAFEEAVGLDPVLATRAIQLASAPALGQVRPASTFREALTVLGVRGLRNLAYAQFSRRMVIRSGVIDQLLWEVSLAAAAATQLLLEAREPALADDAYLCGLLHNVGAVALNNAHPDRYGRALRAAIAGGRPIVEAERAEFGCDSFQVTQQLVASWSLPPRVARTLESWQRNAAAAGSMDAPLRWACTTALRMSPLWQRLLADRPEPDWIARELEAVESGLGLSAGALEEVRRSTAARCDVLRGLVA